MDEKPKKDWTKLEIGALWKKTSATQPYYSGDLKIEDKVYKIMCFTNKHKTEDRHPDIRVYLSDESPQESAIL